MSVGYRFGPGQRWISTNEPELGIGIIKQADNRFVEIQFPSHKSERRYAVSGAPLKRIIFSIGEIIKDRDGKDHTVTGVDEDLKSGLVTYAASNVSIPETDLAYSINIATPDKRFLAGIADSCADFELRTSMVKYRSRILGSEVRGFAGGRIDLLPHQIFISETVAARKLPRALLADETGLGKTIEAALILHRLVLTGRVSRVLLLVPETLVHQWFVELLRRFNILCTLITDEILQDKDETNIFLEDEMFIVDMSHLAQSPLRAAQVCKAPWDLVIIDEVHHVKSDSAESALVHELAGQKSGMLLLSATPEQFGIKNHFSRLQVLDPVRFRSWEEYQNERESTQVISDCIENSCRENGISTDVAGIDEVRVMVPESLLSKKAAQEETGRNPPTMKEVSIGELIDLYAMGRVQFRNTRKMIKGFPVRVVNPVEVQGNDEINDAIFTDLDKCNRFHMGTIPAGVIADDPRVTEIAKLVKRLRKKILVLCGKKEVAVTIQEQLQKLVGVNIALFHEDMTLIQRDRNAAWFEEENGADVLISSESGSEGRNFQFCSHLVLFDLPWNPELLEQRIGRLDRIGQGDTITIHIPYFKGTVHEMLFRWYEEGVGCISANIPAAGEVFDHLETVLVTTSRMLQSGTFPQSEMENLLQTTRTLRDKLNSTLFSHRDHLLELSSNRPAEARKMIEAIEHHDRESIASQIVETLFPHYGIAIEEGGADRCIMLTEYLTDHAFPLPRIERPTITCNRALACMRDDIEFLTIDHPMITGALDLYLSSDHGTSCFALWRDDKVKEIVVECIFVLECIAPEKLYTDRFLPALPLRVVVNHLGENVAGRYSIELCKVHCENGPIAKLLAAKSINEVFSKMVQKCVQMAVENAKPLVAEAIEKIDTFYDKELLRLQKLASRGASLAQNEWEEMSAERCEVKRYLSEARTRLECVRVIRRGPVS
ncbi:MAG TPA: RNA polymerase-associated protein RapA [Chitinispirillaceae bacterium]|nr:RNA polymerase-associated protein RapA [Chitinispirillaceae bacterium]